MNSVALSTVLSEKFFTKHIEKAREKLTIAYGMHIFTLIYVCDCATYVRVFTVACGEEK
jgi:hypothetical protein